MLRSQLVKMACTEKIVTNLTCSETAYTENNSAKPDIEHQTDISGTDFGDDLNCQKRDILTLVYTNLITIL